MDKKEQFNSDKKVLASLEAEYKRTQRVISSTRALVTDINFDELIPDSQERCLMVDELQAYDYIRTNLMNRIRFYRNRIKANKPEPWEEPDNGINDWSKYEKTNRYKISVDVSSEGDHSACCQVCGDNITAQHHCGQDAKEEDHVSLSELLGMEVIGIGGSEMKCEDCSWNCDNCVKVELVGGDYICLAEPEQEGSTTEIDDSPKSFEEAYRDSMNLLREFCIKQSEANQRLVEALKEESEELKKPVINFDEENNDSLCDAMQEIKEKVDDFMNYLDSVING